MRARISRPSPRRWSFAFGALAIVALAARPAAADDDAPPASDGAGQVWAIHGQFTSTTQYHPAFHAAFSGPNSLDAGNRGDTTNDATLFVGLRLWAGAEIWANPEIDQGFGLSNTLGVAGFTSGEAYKVGASTPYFRLQRWFARQTIDLGGERQAVEADQNQLAGSRTADRLVFTIGKFSVVDIFDTNKYAHDPKSDFLNWSLIDTAAYD